MLVLKGWVVWRWAVVSSCVAEGSRCEVGAQQVASAADRRRAAAEGREEGDDGVVAGA